MKIALTRRESFCASHRLHAQGLSNSANAALFGPCNNANGHGHNYVIEVTVAGPVAPDTGLVMNLADLKAIILDQVIAKVDHKHLNLDVAEFHDLNPTAENIALVIWRWLTPHLPHLSRLVVRETDKNSATIEADS